MLYKQARDDGLMPRVFDEMRLLCSSFKLKSEFGPKRVRPEAKHALSYESMPQRPREMRVSAKECAVQMLRRTVTV